MPNTPDPIEPCEVNTPANTPHPPHNTSDTTDTGDTGARLARLREQLAQTRRAYANLVAACRAALTAQRDGDEDPLWFVRDELPAAPPGHPLSTDPPTDPSTDPSTGRGTSSDDGGGGR